MLLGAVMFPHITSHGPFRLTIRGRNHVRLGDHGIDALTPNLVSTFQLGLEASSLEHILNKLWEVEEITTVSTALTN